MREVTEKRTCDGCGAKIYKDTGMWLGSEMKIYTGYCTNNVYETELKADLCYDCSDKIKEIAGLKGK